MDIVTIDPVTYLQKDLVEGLSSKIWTERYALDGDFEFTTRDVDRVMTQLPEFTLVANRETDEIMQVETHNVGKDGVLKITGRSLTSYVDQRDILGSYGKKFTMARNYSPLEAIEVMLWNAFVNATKQDVLRKATTALNLIDVIPNVVITESLKSTAGGVVVRRWLQQGNLTEQIGPLFENSGLGLRIVRPNSTSGVVISVTPTGTSKGVVSRKTVAPITQLRFDVYNGADRTNKQTVLPPIVFQLAANHIKNPEYLFSVKNFKNLADVRSKYGNKTIWANSSESQKTGFGVRRLFVDAGEPDDGETKSEFIADLAQFGEQALAQNNRVAHFDAEVSPTAPYKYKVDYDLGDKVTLIGGYNFNRTMTVTEYIRTEDSEGDRGFPSFLPLAVEDGVSTEETS